MLPVIFDELLLAKLRQLCPSDETLKGQHLRDCIDRLVPTRLKRSQDTDVELRQRTAANRSTPKHQVRTELADSHAGQQGSTHARPAKLPAPIGRS